ncbi:MAG TPA: polysaccharide biosynthesis tyrosine autokinase [Tepidisphaeraceae bacterium]|nr:polysaccharide biosynthesis tyrosine autokinase [Tepidisphaeraceae bacterium]
MNISESPNNFLAKATSYGARMTPAPKPEQAIIGVVWQRRRLVTVCMFAALIVGGLYLLIAPSKYTSTAEVYIDEGQGRGVIGQTPGDLERSDDYLNTQCEIMTSEPILAMALSEDGIKDLDTLHGVGDQIDYLRKYIDAEVGKNSDLIYVSLEAHNPHDAAKIVNAVVQAYVTYQTKTQHSTSAEVLDLLQKERSRDELAIAVKDRELATLRDMYGETAYDSSLNDPFVQQETALSNALTAARLDAVNAKAAYDQAIAMVGNDQQKLKAIEAPDDAGDLGAASATDLDLIKSEIFRLEQQLKDYQRTYLPDHPLVMQASSRLNQLTITYIRAERERWLSAKGQEDALQASFDQQHRQVLSQATRAADFDRVRTELARIEKDLDIVANRINEVSVNQDAGSLNISISQPAEAPLKPSHPSKKVVLGGSLLAGLLLGCVLSLWQEKMAPLNRQTNLLASGLGSPVLGVLPSMEGLGATLAARAMQTHLDPTGAVAEASRGIARTLAELGLDDEGGRTLLVAGVNPLEGRTTLAVNLALAMVQSGLKVLLVDANNRSPRLHNIFKLDNTFGLFDVLSGRTADQPAINATSVESLDVLPSGKVPESTIELLNSETLIDILGELSDRYDRVIIDSPVLGRGVEGRILAASCAASILVTAARPTARRQIEQGLRLLRSVGANVLGLVINEPGPVDPLNMMSGDSGAMRGALSREQARAFRPVLTAGTDDDE